jgi:alpha-tubulin suppressor-like RCC1 family protein
MARARGLWYRRKTFLETPMRARLSLIASSLILISCGSKDEFDDEPFQQDTGAAITADSGSISSPEAGSSGGNDSGSSGFDAGSNDAGSSAMDAGRPDAGSADTGILVMDGGAPDAALDGALVDGATSDGGPGAVATLGAACTTPLDKACTGNNSADKLVCLDGKWAHNGSCDTDQRCETQKGPSQGLCVVIATGCAGKTPGATVCDGTTVKSCGPDLTTLTTTTMCSANSHCEDGTPASCKCDTGYTAGTGGTCTNADDCSSKPCGPDGSGNTCTDALNDYTCTCGSNYWARDSKACISRFDRVAAGGNRTCAIRRDRTVACWGEDIQSGGSSSPVPVAGLTTVTQLTVGADHACARRENGTVACWGHNDHGQLGNGNTNDSLTTPVSVSNLNNVAQVSAGAGFTCAVVNGTGWTGPSVYCWGDNRAGQLGINNANANAALPQRVGGANYSFAFAQVSAGTGHACGRDAGSNLRCWGRNNHGQLGNNTNTPERVPAPVAVTGGNLAGLAEVVAGDGFTCVRRGGSVHCWGAPIAGGDGADVLQPPAEAIAGLSNVTQLSAGPSAKHVCARLSSNNGSVVCWGSDAAGQLGNGDGGDSATPFTVPNLGAIREVAAGAQHTCAVRSSSDGDILCWGEGSAGELGNAARSDSQTPVVVAH